MFLLQSLFQVFALGCNHLIKGATTIVLNTWFLKKFKFLNDINIISFNILKR